MASKLKYRGRKNERKRCVVGYFTLVELQDGSECFIGASTMKTVKTFWNRLSTLDLDASKVTRCKLYSDNK